MIYPYGTVAIGKNTSYPTFNCLDNLIITDGVKQTLRTFALECVGSAIAAMKKARPEYVPSPDVQSLLKIVQDELEFQEPIDSCKVDNLIDGIANRHGIGFSQSPEYGLIMTIQKCTDADVIAAATWTAYNSRNVICTVNQDKDPAQLKFWTWQEQNQRLEEMLSSHP